MHSMNLDMWETFNAKLLTNNHKRVNKVHWFSFEIIINQYNICLNVFDPQATRSCSTALFLEEITMIWIQLFDHSSVSEILLAGCNAYSCLC